MAGHGVDAAEELPVVNERALLQRVIELQQALESGDNTRAEFLVDDITRLRESTLFREMGAITRQLHEALVGLQLDPQIATLCEHAIPDAKLRLDYVLKKTEAAAHRTLTAVEEALPVCASLVEQSTQLGTSWRSFQRRELSAAEFRALTRDMEGFLASVTHDSTLLNEKLAEVLIAQDYQDLTGQVIRRIVDLVQDVQDHLVELMRKGSPSGARAIAAARPGKADSVAAEGPQVGAASAANVVQSQDDVDDLLSSLGF